MKTLFLFSLLILTLAFLAFAGGGDPTHGPTMPPCPWADLGPSCSTNCICFSTSWPFIYDCVCGTNTPAPNVRTPKTGAPVKAKQPAKPADAPIIGGTNPPAGAGAR